MEDEQIKRALFDNQPDPDREDEADEMDAVKPTEEDAPDKDEDADKKPADREKALFERIWARINERLSSKDVDDGVSFKVIGNHWLTVWSNNFRDREGELFTAKAIDAYVSRVDAGIVPPPELWDSHIPGTKSGQADFVARHGHFLIALGTFDDTARGRAAKAYYKAHARQQGISHGYRFPTSQFDGTDYHAFNTFEISPLQRGAEANRFTSFEGIKEMALTDQKKKRLVEVFGKDEAEKILADYDEKGKALEALNVEYKDFTDMDAPADPPAIENDLASALKELLPDLLEGQHEAIKAAAEALKGNAALSKRLAKIEALLSETPKRASAAKETELDMEDEDDAAIVKQIEAENADEKAVKAFPGLYDHSKSIPSMFGNSKHNGASARRLE